MSKAKIWILYGDSSFWKSFKAVHYARLKDYSWWNIRHNMRLHILLLFKAITVPAYTNYKVYDLETPYLKGFLIEHKSEIVKGKVRQMIDFQFLLQDRKNTITFIGVDDKSINTVRDVLTTIQPLDNIEASYKALEDRYEGKTKSKYPKEILLMSMMSLEGTTIDNLEELLKILEAKNYKQFYIDAVKEQIQYLKNEG